MSNPDVSGRPTHSTDDCFRSLADATQRDIVRIVSERSPAGIAKDDLAFQLAAVTNDKRLAAVTDDEHQRALVDCHHRALPALTDAGLLEETDDGTVVTTDHWAFDDSGIEAAIAGRTDRASDELDAMFGALADSRRRTVLTVLGNQYHPISTETLARDVAAREAETPGREVDQDHVDQVHLSLVHVHLPALDDAGLVGYDADTERVSYEGHPALRVSWLAEEGSRSGTDSDGRSSSEDRPDGDGDTISLSSGGDVRTLEGRETIVTTGQSLCEQAEDELFMMFTTTGLLEEGCFRRIEDALDRGVDVYLGSRDPRVRDVVRERAPEVVLWEPQLDWFNLPPENEAVGRLVFADREAVLLGTLGTPNPERDGYDETAVLGDGQNNGLVVLMRQVLGSRLDHLDAQSDNFRSEIPL